jgi:glycosyltransferase involved in cell wall biosynthesis
MKISIITTTYNSAETLQKTFDSVKEQNFDNIEYIVIDGGSSDETSTLIKQNEAIISKWISEPDKGIYDAINKGIKLASGDVIGLMHSDDFFADKNVISKVAAAFGSKSGLEAVYGNLNYVDRTDPDKIIRKWISQEYDDSLFYSGWMPAHPTFYLKRSCFEKYGVYNTAFQISADYELMLRMLLRHQVKSTFLDLVMVNMRVGGESNVSFKNRWIANKEDAEAWKINELKPRVYTRWAKPLSKLKQFF